MTRLLVFRRLGFFTCIFTIFLVGFVCELNLYAHVVKVLSVDTEHWRLCDDVIGFRTVYKVMRLGIGSSSRKE